MDYIIYNIFGYKTENLLNISANKIQKAYRDYRSYYIKKRIDIIMRLIPENVDKIEDDIKMEEIYWNNLRKSIKYKL